MVKYAIVVKDEARKMRRIIKEINVRPNGVNIKYAKKGIYRDMLIFDDANKCVNVLDMLAALRPELNIAPLEIQDSKNEKAK